MPTPDRWNSLERMDATFRTARGTATIAICLALIGWIWPLPALGVPASVVALGAILIALFSWFRRDDLSRAGRRD